MSDSTPEDRPLALGDLAEVDSPEIVRAALGRFRRRILVRGLILVLVIAAGVILYPRYFTVRGDLIHDIQHAPGTELFVPIRTGSLDVDIREVRRLKPLEEGLRPERWGVHVFISTPSLDLGQRLIADLFPQRGRNAVVEVLTSSAPPIFPAIEVWATVTTGTPTLDIPVEIVTLGPKGVTQRKVLDTVHLDLRRLHVPTWIWR